MKTIRILCLLLIVAGCSDKDKGPDVDTDAVKYVNDVVDIMEKNSINRKKIDWEKFRADVVAKVATSADINTALQLALTQLNDAHSYIFRENTYVAGSDAKQCLGTDPGSFQNDNIGYIRIPTYSGSDNQFAIDIQNEIKEQDNEYITAWIVDLRNNNGGNMWPMLAGVGPILGGGTAGYFIDPDEKATPWEYKNGSSVYNGQAVNTVPDPYSLINANPRVAVLIDPGTASSGEAIAVAFIGRPNTKSFGQYTCGLSTANGSFTLSDGGLLQLTIAVMADRNKGKKGGVLLPDETTPVVNDAAVTTAVEWLSGY